MPASKLARLGGWGATGITDGKREKCYMRKSELRGQNLCEKEQLLTLFIEHAPVALAMFDRNMRHLIVSRRWSQYFGLGDRDVSGQLHYEVFPDLPDRWKMAHRRGLAGEIVREEEDKYIFPDGSVLWARWEILPWFTRDGDIGGIILFIEDITERKKAEEKLNALNADLERLVEQRTLKLQEAQVQILHSEKLSAIGKLSASVAHEFSSPLLSVMTILKGFCDINLEGKDKALLELALQETSRMKNLIRSLQDFYRPFPGQKKFFEMHALIDSVLLLFRSHLKKKKITAELNYDRKLPLIWGIPDQIMQVILNLLDNAVDACNEGGRINITTQREGGKVITTITDNGIGIDPAQVDRIFQPFYTTKHAVKGTGLGLSVSYGIVKSHHGEIRVESQPGEGSTFTVVIPVGGRDAQG